MPLFKRSLLLVTLATSLALGQAAVAQSLINRIVSPTIPPVPNANCKQENVQVQTQHNYHEDSAQKVLKDYDDEKKSIEDLAKKNGVTVQIRSENYNINTGNDYQNGRDNGVTYTMNGSTSYVVDPKDKAKDFFFTLTSNKIRASMNYNMNDNCSRN